MLLLLDIRMVDFQKICVNHMQICSSILHNLKNNVGWLIMYSALCIQLKIITGQAPLSARKSRKWVYGTNNDQIFSSLLLQRVYRL